MRPSNRMLTYYCPYKETRTGQEVGTGINRVMGMWKTVANANGKRRAFLTGPQICFSQQRQTNFDVIVNHLLTFTAMFGTIICVNISKSTEDSRCLVI